MRVTSFDRSHWRQRSASGPLVSISPMCETSKTPARLRTATCSWRIPSYCTGISQPANGTSRAPARSWRSNSGVRRSVSAAGTGRPQVTPWRSGHELQRKLAHPQRPDHLERLLGAGPGAGDGGDRVADHALGVDHEGRAERRAVLLVHHAEAARELLARVGDDRVADRGETRAGAEPGAVDVPGVHARGDERGALE